MTILVDECIWGWRDKLWCHLVSDTSFDELHAFANRLGIPRVGFQGDHYDVHEAGRELALSLGATATTGKQLVRALTNAGLRRGPQLTNRGLTGVAHLPAPSVETSRLILRQWRDSDLGRFAEIDGDPIVMKFLGGGHTAEAAKTRIDRDAVGLAIRGIGKWAVELRATGELIGRVGLSRVDPLLELPPSLEIGAAIAAEHQGRGFGVEAGQASLTYAFSILQVERVLGLASVTNVASQRTMQRLGMTKVDQIEHPRFADGDPLKSHFVFEAVPERQLTVRST